MSRNNKPNYSNQRHAMTLTNHQYIVLHTLFKGGRVHSYLDEDGWEHALIGKDGENIYTRTDTLEKLKRGGWIEERATPAYTVWSITEQGREYIKQKTML